MAINYGYTINQLNEMVQKQIKKGNGDRYVRISKDDEGNSFHSLFFGFTDDINTLDFYKANGMIDDDLPSCKIVILG